MLDMVRSRARVDVLSGTSAGGINGAALALAQTNKLARLDMLRDLYCAKDGQIESLLRQPFSGSPSSLLTGRRVSTSCIVRVVRQGRERRVR